MIYDKYIYLLTITYDTCEEERKQGKTNILRLYAGETSRGCHEIYRGHDSQYRAKTGFMYKHAMEHHDGNMQLKFSIKRVNVDRDPLRRVMRESVRINEYMKDENSKEEYFGLKTIRTEFSQGW